MADLHLGRRLGELDLLEDQRAALEGIVDIAWRVRPQVCLIAGDVYDRAVPPAEAVELFGRFLSRLVQAAPVCLIGGNHDSQERLGFARELLRSGGLYIAGKYQGRLERVTLADEWGPVYIWLMPFFRLREARPFFPDDPPESLDQAVKAALAREDIDFAQRNVLVMHQFVTAGGQSPQLCESESLPEAIGGLDAVDAASLEGFCYVALGHLHGPQRVGGERVRYAGSLLKYSASEAAHRKGLVVGEVGPQGQVTLRAEPIPRLHDVRCIRGTLEQLLSPQAVEGGDSQDYLFATLTDERMPLSPRERLEAVYPNLVKLAYQPPALAGAAEESVGAAAPTPLEQFAAFFAQMNGRPMDEGEARAARDACRAVWEEEA